MEQILNYLQDENFPKILLKNFERFAKDVINITQKISQELFIFYNCLDSDSKFNEFNKLQINYNL